MKKVCIQSGKDGRKVKTSGGIGNYSDLCGMLENGADRIGVSKGVLIMEEALRFWIVVDGAYNMFNWFSINTIVE